MGCRDLPQLTGLKSAAEDPAFLAEWAAVKLEAKKKAAAFLQQKTGLVIDPTAMFDVQVCTPLYCAPAAPRLGCSLFFVDCS